MVSVVCDVRAPYQTVKLFSNIFAPYVPNHILGLRFTSIKHFHKITTGSPPTGALNTAFEWHQFRDFLPISRYLANDTK